MNKKIGVLALILIAVVTVGVFDAVSDEDIRAGDLDTSIPAVEKSNAPGFPVPTAAADESEGKLPPLFVSYESKMLGNSAGLLAPKSYGGEKAASRMVATINVTKMADKHLETDKMFTTSAGIPVRVSLTQAFNSGAGKYDKFYFTFKTPKTIQLVNALEIANIPGIKNGFKKLDLGEGYTARFNITRLEPMNNELVVKRAGNIVFKTSMQSLADSMRKTSKTVNLSREYHVILVSKIMKEGGKLIRQPEKMLIFFAKDFKSTVIPVNAISRTGVSFPDFETEYSFSRSGDNIEISRL